MNNIPGAIFLLAMMAMNIVFGAQVDSKPTYPTESSIFKTMALRLGGG
uniref:Uncharacterized protein n=1 Tax=Candidatus Kentrum sp. TC TaxID=2126339 RepID=A0A450ZCE8_9GAMM|nr:MAG: hypothetical protein BECKTC1821D_GA0114238_100139 [Candidatus Kentron sp. TC]VFK37730.1 MAG: hypothetical protein BECKTC1821E_GA0114239_100177 [Candidatus Kentron sp. TC]VFK51457.1 MAG: hypothetical protein BECKTC1821F_GA0114240_1001102 [Candidatus Kentron sp. TC]